MFWERACVLAGCCAVSIFGSGPVKAVRGLFGVHEADPSADQSAGRVRCTTNPRNLMMNPPNLKTDKNIKHT